MITALIVVSSVAAYLAVAALTARRLFGDWRARGIDKSVAARMAFPYSRTPEVALKEATKSFNEVSRAFCQGSAVGAALIWPLSLLLAATVPVIASFLNGTPVRARAEVEAEHAAMAVRIAELEKELGYREGPP